MDRAAADAVIRAALQRDPDRVSEVIANVARSLIESGRYSEEEVNAAIEELRAELDGRGRSRH
jgi:hypothetical protein